MNRANSFSAFLLGAGLLAPIAPAQEPSDGGKAQTDPVARIVSEIRAAEARLKSLRLELRTSGEIAPGASYRTSGTLHVLRGEHPRLRSSVRFEFAEGLSSRLETARTEDGILVRSTSPAFGEVFVRVSPELVRDLEWAGGVLGRSDLPGMRDARAEAPLGSSILVELGRRFDLEVLPRSRRGDDEGTWLGGKRRPGLDVADPDLPAADRVEVFVRTADHALLEVLQHRGKDLIEHIEVTSLEVGVDIAPEVFTVDGRGEALRAVETYEPMWAQIQSTIARAEAKLLPPNLPEGQEPPPECLRPSRRR